MLLRVCIENLTHSVPRIMGWTKTKYEGKTHGICDDCMQVYQVKISEYKEKVEFEKGGEIECV